MIGWVAAFLGDLFDALVRRPRAGRTDVGRAAAFAAGHHHAGECPPCDMCEHGGSGRVCTGCGSVCVATHPVADVEHEWPRPDDVMPSHPDPLVDLDVTMNIIGGPELLRAMAAHHDELADRYRAMARDLDLELKRRVFADPEVKAAVDELVDRVKIGGTD